MKLSPVLGANQLQAVSVSLAHKTVEARPVRKAGAVDLASRDVGSQLPELMTTKLKLGAASTKQQSKPLER